MSRDDESHRPAGQAEGLSSSALRESGPARLSWFADWPRWSPYAAVVWSLLYAGLALYWAVGRHGFPYSAGLAANPLGPIAGRFGPAMAWLIVIVLGFPAVIVGLLQLRRAPRLRIILIACGSLLAGILLLLMADINLLIMLGYIPYSLFGLLTGAAIGQSYLANLIQSIGNIAYQLFCLLGGFLWLAATVSYARRSAGACPYCGRRDASDGWNSPNHAARWGRLAVYVAMLAPVIYAFTRYAWALGIPLGMSREHWRLGQQSGLWTSGLFLATFGLVGALLMLGLVQRWGEVFPRWMLGLAGRQVPLALAMVPAAIVSVLVVVGGIGIWSGLAQVAENAAGVGENLWVVVGPTLLFPLWGIALAVATLAYYYRRRGPCKICARRALLETR